MSEFNDNVTANVLENCLNDAKLAELPGHESGKVRESYNLPDDRRIMIATDRQSAFDFILDSVPYKGQVLNQTSQFWFEITEDICPNHVIEFPDPNIIVTQRLKMLPIEIIVRDYLTGSTETSIWPMYQRGERRMYGHNFPNNLVKNQKLPSTIITPTTKAVQGEHDTPITADEILKTQLLTKEIWNEATEKSMALFSRGREIALANGLILVDTKYEFGIDKCGILRIADEIHTPDSSRFWIKSTYDARMEHGKEPESLDKEFLRLWITANCDPYNEPIPAIPKETIIEFSKKYILLFEQITGQVFKKPPPNQSVHERIRINLAKAFPEYF